jgi:4-hydroxybenzoate polyprenyltransferase
MFLFCFQVYTLNISNPVDCSIKFVSNQNVGLLLFVGIVMGKLLNYKEENNDERKKIE